MKYTQTTIKNTKGQGESNKSSPCNAAAYAVPAQSLSKLLKPNNIKQPAHVSAPTDQEQEAPSYTTSGHRGTTHTHARRLS
jgi:hypothetical protein